MLPSSRNALSINRRHSGSDGDETFRQGRDNEPIVRVAWHDALRFCVWLTEAWRGHLPAGWVVTLPSEAEWEKAARGGEQIPARPEPFTLPEAASRLRAAADGPVLANPWPRRAYPWGDDFDAERANVQQAIGEPSALGAFPAGASPVGAEEMAGNVWEWTRSLYGKDIFKPTFGYPYQADDARREDLSAKDDVYRVVRGGSWSGLRVDARCAYRDWYSPVFRYGYLGFRVVLRSSPVEMPLWRRVLRAL